MNLNKIMKKITTYILGAIVLGFVSCVTLEDSFIPDNNRGMISVMASVADLSTVNVGTKAVEESHVESLAMIIFDKNGKLLGEPVYADDINFNFSIDTKNGRIIDEVTSIPLIPEGKNGYDLSACSIYMVANAEEVLRDSIIVKDDSATVEDDRTTEQKFLNITIPVQSIVIPENGKLEKGIPMMGKSNVPVDLSTSVSEATVTNVTMRKLFAKVNVRFQVNATQVVGIPSFTIIKWTVNNIPNKVRLGELDGETICANMPNEGEGPNVFATGELTDLSYGKATIYHASDYFEFTFYVPEQKVTPDSEAYPEGTNIEEPQRYKPLLCSGDKNPMYVTVNGEYVDHNNIVKSVTYSLYLGQNESDNFEVKRNQELNNIVTIKGLTNSASASTPENPYNISVDHRVVVNFDGFSLSMEREAILDSHFEVRPLDITLSPNSSLKIAIPEEYQSWIAIEDNLTGLNYTENNSPYISGKGVRKYFTTNLVSELNGKNTGTLTITNSDTKAVAKRRVWIYIDENVNVYDKLLNAPNGVTSSPRDDTYTVGKNMYRLGKINVKYSGPEGTTNVSLNMQQWNLWRVWSADHKRYYDIEHEEEYLNNYASDQGYGNTDEGGMPWGLEGIQLSQNVMAYWKESANGILAEIINFFFRTDNMANNVFSKSGKAPQYDFYLKRDNFPVNRLENNVDKTNYSRDYQGFIFNQEIANTLLTNYKNDPKAKIDGILLTEKPASAFAYCYNKNKRNANGEVTNQKWYLPSIDEIEDIALGAYDEFDKVFQNKKYWSCQPAYDYYSLEIQGYNYVDIGFAAGYLPTSNLKGEFYTDNITRARATSVYTTDGTSYTNIKSGLPDGISSGSLLVNAYSGGNKAGQADTHLDENVIDYSSAEFKAEYSGNVSRTEECRIRSVYRSGSVQ